MIKMNMQALMREAQKMQKNLQKTQEELLNSKYEGTSSFVTVILFRNVICLNSSFETFSYFSNSLLYFSKIYVTYPPPHPPAS